MNAKELIGKCAIRTRPILLNNHWDTSFTDQKCFIEYADDDHVIVKSVEGYLKGERFTLNCLYVDNNWKPYSVIEQGLLKLELQIKIGKIYVK